MKKQLTAVTLFALTMGSFAMADTAASVPVTTGSTANSAATKTVQRDVTQQEKTEQGLKAATPATKEVSKSENEQAGVEKAEAKGGKLSTAEQKPLVKEHKAKTSAQAAAPESANGPSEVAAAKTEQGKSVHTHKHDSVKSTDSGKPVDSAKSADSVKPVDGAKPVDNVKPTDSAKPTDGVKPSESVKH